MRVELLSTQEDFELILDLIRELSAETNVPFTQNVHEVSASFVNPNYLTFVAKNDKGLPRAYVCGYFLSSVEFLVTQCYSKRTGMTQELSNFMDSYLQKSTHVRKIIGFSFPPPEVFEPYGYKLERYIISKTIAKESE